MRKLFLLVVVSLLGLSGYAVPAKRGLWKTLTLADGSTVRAELCGDEHGRYYRSADGTCYSASSEGTYQRVDEAAVAVKAKARRARQKARMRRKNRTSVAGTQTAIMGEKKGLIILVQFSDTKFEAEHNNAFYQRVANEKGFTSEDGFVGSVADYFRDQSLGQFELTFDVVGPVTLNKQASYYGANDTTNYDEKAHYMVIEACQAVASQVDFSKYDWNNDGEAEEVFVLYAGLGEANGGEEDTVWPHMWYISYSDYRQPLTFNGTRVDCYACSSELAVGGNEFFDTTQVDGIGTFCHEFSHCLGFPDVYDTSGNDNFGMSTWSLMDYGSYNNDGFTPSGYTAYERWVAGWITPVELTEDTEVSALKAVKDGGSAYIAYNDANHDEVIMWENRPQKDWDAEQYGSGLLIYHIDYDEEAWYMNEVNNDADRQRITIYPADNDASMYEIETYEGEDYYSFDEESLKGDPFPYKNVNKFGAMANIKASWYNNTTAGNKAVGFSLTNITKDSEGLIGFKFRSGSATSTDHVFYESFDKNEGKGGNDGENTSNSRGNPMFDLDGWTYNWCYRAAQCVRISKSNANGYLLSPEVTVSQGDVISWRSLAYGDDKSIVTVTFINSSTNAETTLLRTDLNETDWQEFEVKLTFGARGKFKFESAKRQFLDEVMLKKPTTSGIEADFATETSGKHNRIYSVDGRYMGTDLNALGRGIYIINGKKVVK